MKFLEMKTAFQKLLEMNILKISVVIVKEINTTSCARIPQFDSIFIIFFVDSLFSG